MVQIQMKPLPSTTDSHPQAQTSKSFDSIISQHQLSNSTGANISDTGIFSKSNLSSFITWTSKSDISSNRSSVQLQSSVEAKTNKNRINALNTEEESLYFSTSKDIEARINSKSDYMSPMQKPNSEGSETDQKSFLSAYQESLMSTCSEIIDSLTSEKDSDGISKNIKIERSGSTEQDDWISGFDTSISTEPTKGTSVTIKQELQLDEAAFNRSARSSSSSYGQQNFLPLSLMPPTSSSASSHETQGVRSNSLSSVSGDSVNDTEISCTSPSPSSMSTTSASNTLSTFNANQSQVNQASHSATSPSMVNRHNSNTPGSPSSNSSSVMTSPSAPTPAGQHSFTLTPLGTHLSSGYGGISGTVGGSYFTPGCGSNSSRFGGSSQQQQQHNFDGAFPSTWTAPFGGAGIARANYNGIPQFMSSQNQVFSGSPFQNSVVSNAEGASPFFTHGSGGGGLVSGPSNGGQVADRNSRGADSNESSPHGVNSGSDSPHLGHGIFGHGVDDSHVGSGGGVNPAGGMGGTTGRKREIRLIKNREAARECRRKKKEYIKCLENRVAVLENQNKALIEELKSLKSLYNNSSSTNKVASNEGMKSSNKM